MTRAQRVERLAWIGLYGMILVGAITGDVPWWVAIVMFGTTFVAWLVQRLRRHA